MNKENVMHEQIHVHTHTQEEYHSVIKKKKVLPFATARMNYEGITLN